MKRTKYVFAIALLCVSALLFSCKKAAPDQTKHIPKEASYVIGLDVKSLQEKLMSGGLSIDSLVKAFGSGSAMEMAEELRQLNDLQNSGIDWGTKVYVFASAKGSMMNGQQLLGGLVAKLSDAAKFEAYLKKQEPLLAPVKDKEITWVALKGGKGVIGWNSNTVIIYGESKQRGFLTDADGNNASPATPAEGPQKQLLALFNQKESESVVALAEFKEFAAAKGDVTFFTNSSSTLDQVPMIGATKVVDLFKNTYSIGGASFTNGKVEASFKSIYNKEMTDILKKNAGGKANFDLLDHYPSSNVNGFAILSFNPNLIMDILTFAGLDTMVNNYLQRMGFTLADVCKAFKGDMAFIMSDFAIVKKPAEWDPSVMREELAPKFVFNAVIADKTAFDKVMAAFVKQGLFVKQGNKYNLNPANTGNMKQWVEADGNNLVLASDTDVYTRYKAGTEKVTYPAGSKDKIAGKPYGMYVNIQSILKALPESESGSQSEKVGRKGALQLFKEGYMVAGELKGNTMEGNAELTLMNEKDNSLVQLARYALELNAAIKADRASAPVDVVVDSAVAIPAPPPPPPAMK